jgi:hypothetical protein
VLADVDLREADLRDTTVDLPGAIAVAESHGATVDPA